GDLFSQGLKDKLAIIVNHHNAVIEKLYDAEAIRLDETLDDLNTAVERIRPFVGDVAGLVKEHLDKGNEVLFEGAQGTLLDIDHGFYPYVTSSNPGTLSIPVDIGISPKMMGKVVGLTKAYATRVGAGPFPTEDEGEMGDRLQDVGNEFGAATGRRRRCGWLDLPLLRYAAELNGVDGLAITKLDVLDSFRRLKVCTGYRQPDEMIKDLITPRDFDPGEPIYAEIEGWMSSTSDARTFEELPEKAQYYVNWISEQVGVPIWMVSVGQCRKAVITLPDFPF
ncbi:adenylosuccinate synthase, partial [candidate division WOR-3 bacterium]|nr:adenylosuccinate synthase [candidate division WOR-3 bacterium]MBD3364109.1 adenylosuccinate synthase [candidate division WOR-3 bacterium]